MYTSFIYGLCEPDWKTIRYVGSSKRLHERYQEHLIDSSDTYKVRWIKSVIREGSRPTLIILDVALHSDVEMCEKMWIRILREGGADLTNATDGGDGVVNPSEETRKKMSNAKKGKPCPWHGKPVSKETVDKIRLSKIGKLLAPCSEERKRKISLANLGRKLSMESRMKMSRSQKGKIRSEEYKQNLRMLKTGTHLSEESKKKISSAHKGRIFTEDWKRKLSKSLTGRKLSAEHVRKCAEATRLHGKLTYKGRRHSEETRKKISIAGLGRICTEETRKKLSDAKKGKPSKLKGIPRSAETKAKISLSNKGRLHTDEERQRMSISGKARCERMRLEKEKLEAK